MPRIRSAFALAALLALGARATPASRAHAQPAAVAVGQPDASLPRVITTIAEAQAVGSALAAVERSSVCFGNPDLQHRLAQMMDAYRQRGSVPEWVGYANGMAFAVRAQTTPGLPQLRPPDSRETFCVRALDEGRIALARLTGRNRRPGAGLQYQP